MMKKYYIYFINNEYQMRGNKSYYAYDTEDESPVLLEFLKGFKEDLLDSIQKIEFETSENVTDAFVEVTIESFLELSSEQKEDNISSKFDDAEIVEIYIDMDDTIVDYKGRHNEMTENCPEMLYPQANYGFFANLDPLDDAVRVIKRMMNEPKFMVSFATAPSIKNPLSYTEKRVCIEKLFGLEACNDLIIIRRKNKLDDKWVYLIDDKKDTHGQDKFVKGEHLHFGHGDYKNWKDIESFFFD